MSETGKAPNVEIGELCYGSVNWPRVARQNVHTFLIISSWNMNSDPNETNENRLLW